MGAKAVDRVLAVVDVPKNGIQQKCCGVRSDRMGLGERLVRVAAAFCGSSGK